MQSSRQWSACRVLIKCGLLALVASAGELPAGDLEWSGTYRAELLQVSNPRLSAQSNNKNYGLHHLVLAPKLVASDDVIIRSRFQLLNAEAFPNSQLGDYWGGDGADGNFGATNSLSETQDAGLINVSELFLTYRHEYGEVIVGRAPVHFGLGITHNAGRGLFDHWYDTRDMIGYRFMTGNFMVFPMFAKLKEGTIAGQDDVTDYMLQAEYDYEGSDLAVGAFIQLRMGQAGGNDAPAGSNQNDFFGGPGSVTNSKYDTRTVSFFAERRWSSGHFGFEGSMLTGSTGVRNAQDGLVKYDAFAVATEWHQELGDKWRLISRQGVASGDDPNTTDRFEGFALDRNYDIAFLMFNHPLGQADLLRTSVWGGGPEVAGGAEATPDTENLSNAYYLAPTIEYSWSRWRLLATLATAFLTRASVLDSNMDKNLGYEFDIAINFAPNKRVMWVNQLGVLMPGSAFEVGGLYDSDFAYGVITKAAISF